MLGFWGDGLGVAREGLTRRLDGIEMEGRKELQRL